MAAHRILLPEARLAPGQRLEVAGPEAHHALRVKRLGEGDLIEVLDGRGTRANAAVAGIERRGRGEWTLVAEVREAAQEAPVRPAVRVLAAAPKGPRLEEMLDQLSQVGAASWAPLMTARTVVSPRMGRLLRAERIAQESAKQCGRSWVMEIGDPTPLVDALSRAGTRVVLADVSGDPFEHDGAEDVTLLVGPEGGFSEGEVRGARQAGAAVCRFGLHTMRVETAAVVAAAIVLDGAARAVRG